MNNRNWPPFYIEPERPSLLGQFEEALKVIKLIDELKKADKPKEEKKEEKKPNVFKNWLLTTIGLIAAFPFLVWMSMSLYMDLILKAKHLPLQ